MAEPQPSLDVEALIEGAMHDASLESFINAGVPLAFADELGRALRGPALRHVLEARVEQIVKHGHDAEHDAMLSIDRLPQLAKEHAQMALEVLGNDERRNIPVAIRRLARSAAINLAAIDRLLMTKEGTDAAA